MFEKSKRELGKALLACPFAGAAGGALVYSGYTKDFPGCRDSDFGIRTGIPVIRGYMYLKIDFL